MLETPITKQKPLNLLQECPSSIYVDTQFSISEGVSLVKMEGEFGAGRTAGEELKEFWNERDAEKRILEFLLSFFISYA